jgi:hypothetical protein
MYDDIGQRIITGNSIPLPEYDDDDDRVNSKYGDPVEEEALKSYWFQTALGTIGTDEFKESFLLVIDKIRADCSLEEQREFCFHILFKIKEIHDFELPINFEIVSDEEIWEVYNLIAFIEYNHKMFLIKVWRLLNVNPDKLDIDIECKTNSENIISAIDSLIARDKYTQMIKMFLGTNIKENIIGWFNKISTKNLHLIKYELMKLRGE